MLVQLISMLMLILMLMLMLISMLLMMMMMLMLSLRVQVLMEAKGRTGERRGMVVTVTFANFLVTMVVMVMLILSKSDQGAIL